MGESKHTQGPWRIGTRKDGSQWFSIGNPETGPHYQADIYCSEADARLIAAAPELLAELQESRNAWAELAELILTENNGRLEEEFAKGLFADCQRLGRAADQAIAKAKATGAA